MIIVLCIICVATIFSINYTAFFPMEFSDFIQLFITSEENRGMIIWDKKDIRVRAVLNEFPSEIDNSDINNIRNTLSSMGFNPDMASLFAYKIEYKFPSNVSWEKETRLIFYIQEVQGKYFEQEYKLNDTIYWFISFRQFNEFTQRGYFIVSDFLNQEQFDELLIK